MLSWSSRFFRFAGILVVAGSLVGCQRNGIESAANTDLYLPSTSDREPFKIFSWNLENFIDPFDDPYIINGREDEGLGKSAEELELIARAISIADADVITLQEVESDRAVKYFLDSYLPGHTYQYFAAAPSLNWSQNTVIASRYPIGAFTSLREEMLSNEVLNTTENKYNSRLLIAEIRPTDDYSFYLAGLHLKAGSNPEDPVWRQAQIRLLSKHLSRLIDADDQTNIVLAGDFNLIRESPEYALLMGQESLELVDSMAAFGGLDTHPSNAPSRQIDYIMFNQNMANEYVADSLAVARPLSLSELSELSDHLPLIASFYPENLDGSAP